MIQDYKIYIVNNLNEKHLMIVCVRSLTVLWSHLLLHLMKLYLLMTSSLDSSSSDTSCPASEADTS